jgi:hypothetical protein
MEKTFQSNNRTVQDRIGLYLLLILLTINPFHFEISDKSFLFYYREIISFLFMMLWLSKIIYLKNWNNRLCHQNDNKIMFFLIIFPVLLGIFAIADSGTDLYSTNYLFATSADTRVYVLRNAFLYIPMVIYFAVRGLTKNEVQRIAFIIIMIAPFSVISFLVSSEIATIRTIGKVAELGGTGLSYNSYVPYLTIPILSAIYILSSKSVRFWTVTERNNIFINVYSFFVFIFLTSYTLLSTSRQSVLYIFFTIFFFLFKINKNILKKIFITITIIVTLVYSLLFFIGDYSLSTKFKDRFYSSSGAIETSRLEKITHGLSLLQPVEYFIGAGLTSVMVSGPHNDYVRWWQRVGIFTMLIGFFPFFMAFFKAYRLIQLHPYNGLYIYLTLFIFFILYHSFFGYPREDAFQAPYCFLGLAIWFGIRRDIEWDKPVGNPF